MATKQSIFNDLKELYKGKKSSTDCVTMLNSGLEMLNIKNRMAFSGIKNNKKGIHIVRKNCKYKLGIYGEFDYNAFGQYLETTTPQFVLKVENKRLYDKVDVDNSAYNYYYDMYIRADIAKKSFAYIEYKENSKFLDRKLSLLEAYKKALELVNKGKINQGRIINVFIYENFVFFLDEKFLSDDRRRCFKDIEKSVLYKKYTMGARKLARNGAIKASFMQDGIIRKVEDK